MHKILIYNSGGGLGDSIQLFSIIVSLKNHFKNSKIYYLGAHKNHFNSGLKEYELLLEDLDLNLKYFGFRFWHYFFVKKNFNKTQVDKFDLIIDLQSKLRNTLILKRIPHKLFYSTTYNYTFSSIKKKSFSDDLIENLSFYFNTKIEKKEFDIKDLNPKLIEEAKRLLPEKNYVGLSLTQGNQYRKKSWQIDNFIKLSKELIKRKKRPVFFINENKKLIESIKNEISEAIFPELNSKLSCPALVTALASRLEKAITIDNGVMHMISLAKIPMIVLFGPTNSQKFAPKYNGVKVLDSKHIYKSKNINLISVNDVLKEI
jgi:ADP-heptose:LPS heptosyltransferase